MLNAAAIEDEHSCTLRHTEDDDEDTASGSGDPTESEKSSSRSGSQTQTLSIHARGKRDPRNVDLSYLPTNLLKILGIANEIR